jgi:hypothetical protein
MKVKSSDLAKVIFLLALFSLTLCEQVFQIHELEVSPLSKEHFSENLRTHDQSTSNNPLTQAILEFILAPFLFICSFACIWFNEKRAVIDYRRLKLAEEICVDVNPLRRD